jgi:F-type H+-transporting ATPase subunit b
MQFDWSTLALQTANFVVLVWLLHRFLYKPVLRMIEARRTEVEKQFAAARAAETEAKTRLDAVGAERAKIAAERDALLKEATARAESAAARRAERAEQEAAALLGETRKKLAAERSAALAEARGAALDLSVEFARRLIGELPIELLAGAWLERIERHIGRLPAAERESLRRDLDASTTLRVVTAASLPGPVQGEWRNRLARALGGDAKVAFDADPNLVAGAELHFPHSVLRFSWRSAVSTMRTEIEADGDAR